jgi:tRNA (cmo5U34)-methyltransferase
MLDRAKERVSWATAGRTTTVQGDIREVNLPDGEFDIVLAAAVLHHLRTDQEWRDVFAAFYRALRPADSVWVFDLSHCRNDELHVRGCWVVDLILGKR